MATRLNDRVYVESVPGNLHAMNRSPSIQLCKDDNNKSPLCDGAATGMQRMVLVYKTDYHPDRTCVQLIPNAVNSQPYRVELRVDVDADPQATATWMYFQFDALQGTIWYIATWERGTSAHTINIAGSQDPDWRSHSGLTADVECV